MDGTSTPREIGLGTASLPSPPSRPPPPTWVFSPGAAQAADRARTLLRLPAAAEPAAAVPASADLQLQGLAPYVTPNADFYRIDTALVVPNLDRLRRWARHQKPTLPIDDADTLLAHPAVRDKIQAEIERTLGDLAPFERPKKLLLLSRDFSVDAGELTPTLKVRRRIVEEGHRARIEALYA